MNADKGFRGWIAAITVGVTLTLVFLVVDKHLQQPTRGYFHAPQTATSTATTTQRRGILLTVDPGLIATEQFPPADVAPIYRNEFDSAEVNLLHTPPEPAAQVSLRAPTTSHNLEALPLSSSTASIDYLMDALDAALDTPIQIVSAKRGLPELSSNPETDANPDSEEATGQRLAKLDRLAAPIGAGKGLPSPAGLFAELNKLHLCVSPQASERLVGHPSVGLHTSNATALTTEQSQWLLAWIAEIENRVQQLVSLSDLEQPECIVILNRLSQLADQSSQLAVHLTDHATAIQLANTGYAVQRRVAVWSAVHKCLSDGAHKTHLISNHELARQQLLTLLSQIEAKVAATHDPKGWRTYLLLDQLREMANQSQTEPRNSTALSLLSRLRWQRLTETQSKFLSQPEFQDLAAHLTVLTREPVNYHQLLTDLELLEEDPTNRVRYSLASAVQVLRLSDEPQQQAIAAALNDHYRNANVRLTVSGRLLERFLPAESYDVKPVRQRILGADTRGDSQVRTRLSLKLIPDPTAWHVDIGVNGELESQTQSSKGPAVFQSASSALISGHRIVRMDPISYKVTATETDVASQQYLQNMSTDFDGLPIIGDFLRVVAKEQFNQQRGIAKRITHRIIANEADAAFDKQLQENLEKAQKELQQRLVGPLDALKLNPLVVSMATVDDRLTIRYRVANQDQMAAHTSRPRAPGDSLMSMQVHQSAINNTLAQIGLGDRTWKLTELCEKLATSFNHSNFQFTEEIPADVTVRFTPTRPMTVELIDDQLVLTMRIIELAQGEHKIERFIVKTSYVPVANGLSAGLIREGVVSIDGPRLQIRDRLALRTIFAKVFVSRPEIPLVSDSWKSDPRAEGLAVSQVDIRDGWLSVAISEATSPMAAAVAERARNVLVK